MHWGRLALAWLGVLALLRPSSALEPMPGQSPRGLHQLPIATQLPTGQPADPVNVALIGDRRSLIQALWRIGWQPADPATLASMAAFLAAVVLHQPDPRAPFTTNLLFGRPQDLALEQEVDGSPARRHHMRLWLSGLSLEGQPLWLGAVIDDNGIDWRHLAHHIAPDVDAERDRLFIALGRQHQLSALCRTPHHPATARGLTGDGDHYVTDGQLFVGWLRTTPGAAGSTAVNPGPSSPKPPWPCGPNWRPVRPF